MRGTLGATVRTALVVGGITVLVAGIVTLAFPSLLTGLLESGQEERLPQQRGQTPGWGGDTLLVSFVGIVGGLTVTAAGLAVPGRSPYRLLREQPFTRAQRVSVLLGAFFVVGLPALLAAGLTFGDSIFVLLGTVVLVFVGALMVLVGTARGLQVSQNRRPDQNS
ncbi:hypothetical protein [Halorientalis halophila]|uniref:hypothetical protein n=1 Tax=Halorientalis halophila TaxID=3108499 RepID=UPI00300A21C4